MGHRWQAWSSPGKGAGGQVLEREAGKEGGWDRGSVRDVARRVDRGGQVQLVGGGGRDGERGVRQVRHRAGGQVRQRGGEEHARRVVGSSRSRVGEVVGAVGRGGQGSRVRCLGKGVRGWGWVVLDQVGGVGRCWGGGQLGDMGRRRSGGWLWGSLATSSSSTSTFRARGWCAASTPGYLHNQGHGYLCGILSNQL